MSDLVLLKLPTIILSCSFIFSQSFLGVYVQLLLTVKQNYAEYLIRAYE